MDTGISMKRINEGLLCNNLSFDNVEAIVITHEHSDHINGLGPILRKHEIPAYATEATIHYMLDQNKLGKVDTDLLSCIVPDQPYNLAGMEVVPFSISHDAVDPVSYTVRKNEVKVAIATDMGSFSDYTISHLAGCYTLLLEANHDINMLQVGAYPFSLKRRILGNKGHLSNDSTARLISRILHKNLSHILLGHLSQENNTPELAYLTVKYELEQLEEWEYLNAKLSVAKRSKPSTQICL